MNYLICLRGLEYGGTPTFYVSLARELVARSHKVVFASSGGPLQDTIKPLCKDYTFRAFSRESSIAYVLSNRLLGDGQRSKLLNLYPTLSESLCIERDELKYVIRKLLRRGQTRAALHERCRGTLGILASVPKLREIIEREAIDAILCSQASPTLIAYFASRRVRSQPVFLPVVNSFFNCGDLFPPIGCRRITRHARYIIGVCNEISAHLADVVGVPRSKLVVTPNAVDTDKFHPCAGSEDVKSDLGIPAQDQVVVHVSSLVSQKLPMTLNVIDALQQVLTKCPNTSLVIVGGGNAFDEVKKRADSVNQASGRSVVILTGNQDVLLPSIINIAQVVVGIARCAREAMACGKPVIVSGLTGYAGIVSEENIAKVAATNFSGRQFEVKPSVDVLAADIIYLLRNKLQCEQIGRFGRRYIETHDSIDAAANLFEFLSGAN